MAPRPRLCAGVRVVEQVYRGERAYVVRGGADGRYFRFRTAEAAVLRAFDGTRGIPEVVSALADGGLVVPPEAVARFASRLAALGIVERTVQERTTLELERVRAERRRRRTWLRGELLRARLSLGDPDALLTRLAPHLRRCFTRAFVALSLGLFASYLLVLALRAGEVAGAVARTWAPDALTAGAVATFALVSLVVIAVHELAHAVACKHFGGEVHEMGVMLLFFVPAFYCNVNDAWSFPERRERLWVTAAGLWAQLLVASVAALAWTVLAPDTYAAQVALAAMVVGGLTSVLTNLNPLLPLDGYFALADWLETPNLRLRARAHLGWWLRRRLLGMAVPEPPATPRERRIFLWYGALSTAYAGLTFTLVIGLAARWAGQVGGTPAVVAVAIAALTLLHTRTRAWRGEAALLWRTWRARRRRAVLSGEGPAAAGWRRPGRRMRTLVLTIMAASLALPVPRSATGPFTSAPARLTSVAAAAAGVVVAVHVAEGERVRAGAPVVRLRDPSVDRELLRLVRAADSLAAAARAAVAAGAVGTSARLAREGAATAAQLAAVRARREALTLRARTDAVVLTPRPERLLGRRVPPGARLLALGTVDSLEVRVTLDRGAGRVRPGQRVRLVTQTGATAPPHATVASVARAQSAGTGMEARVRLAAGAGWHPGVTGQARVELARTTVLGAAWWAVRTRLRADLLL